MESYPTLSKKSHFLEKLHAAAKSVMLQTNDTSPSNYDFIMIASNHN